MMDRAILHEIDTINFYLKTYRGLSKMTVMIMLKERCLLFNKLEFS